MKRLMAMSIRFLDCVFNVLYNHAKKARIDYCHGLSHCALYSCFLRPTWKLMITFKHIRCVLECLKNVNFLCFMFILRQSRQHETKVVLYSIEKINQFCSQQYSFLLFLMHWIGIYTLITRHYSVIAIIFIKFVEPYKVYIKHFLVCAIEIQLTPQE